MATAVGVDAAQLRRVAVASVIGTTIEWYDFFILSTAVPLVFNTQFFSTLSPASGTLAGFATLGVGILARPVGGVLWGHFGDLFSIVLVVVGLIVRLSLAESPVFTRLLREQARSRRPIVEVFRVRPEP
jgi:MFS family permease